jgi:UDP-N-acetylmuramoyl-tripeptide--D-alanyl-D-alanine ligase
MKKLRLNEIGEAIGLDLLDDTMIDYVSNDIKRVADRTLVFHLNKAEELNIRKFARLRDCFIVTDQPLLKGTPFPERFLLVQNVQTAYRRFADYYRKLFKLPVVAVTGTCGKTTTKEMIAQMLRRNHQVVATESSRNGLRYMHDYLMGIDEKTDFAVFETAITHPGNLTYECEFFKPTVGLITTIGIDHLNWCRSLETYIRTKGELLVGLGKGTLIINKDDRNIRKLDFQKFQGRILTFGINKHADFMAEEISYGEGGMKFRLVHKKKAYQVFVPGYGEHNVYNALGALAVMVVLGQNLKQAITYLADFQHIRSHNEFKAGHNDSTIIDDTWSSNPTSTEAALKVLRDQGEGKTKIAALGQISYLGRFSEIYYQKIAKMILNYQIDVLVTKDAQSRQIGEAAINLGMAPEKVIICNNDQEFQEALLGLLNKDSILLFKCSMLDKSSQTVLSEILK